MMQSPNQVLARFCFAISCAILYLAPSAMAATYIVGGAGADYVNLEALRTSGVLQDGDTIIINADDNSLTTGFTNTLIIKGKGKISPIVPRSFFRSTEDGYGTRIKDITLNSDSLEFSGFETTGTTGVERSGGAIYASNASISGGTNTFSNNSADGGGAIHGDSATISGGTNTFSDNTAGYDGGAIANMYVSITGGENTFSGNTAGIRGGAITGDVTIYDGINMFSDNVAGTLYDNIAGGGGAIAGGDVTINGGTNTFSDNTAGADGGAIAGGVININGGANVFFGNSASASTLPVRHVGGAIAGNSVNITGGANTFSDNEAESEGGAIAANNGGGNITGGTNTFSGNTASFGGAISAKRNDDSGGGNVTISDGTNTFYGNSATFCGGAISAGYNYGFNYGDGTVTITGGTNTFSGNTAGSGGAIAAGYYYGDGNGNVTISGGTNTFFGNTADNSGGAIYIQHNATFRATDGNFTFQKNKDNVQWGTNEKANAFYVNNDANNSTLTLAAEDEQNIYFYDPITSNLSNLNLIISINNLATDTGTVVFDGSDYTRSIDRHSAVYGYTTVGYGTLILNGSVVYGGTKDFGSFTLEQDATLSTDATINRIQANQIMLNGMVDITGSGTLELFAVGSVEFDGITLTLDLESNNASGRVAITGTVNSIGTNTVVLQAWENGIFGGGRHLLDRKRRSISYARSVIFCRLTVPIDLIQFSFR